MLLREPQGASGLLIESFNGKPQASAQAITVACGLPLNENSSTRLNHQTASTGG